MDGKFSQGVVAPGKYGMCSRQWYPRELATLMGPTKWSHENGQSEEQLGWKVAGLELGISKETHYWIPNSIYPF